jgi:hypothetical protein
MTSESATYFRRDSSFLLSVRPSIWFGSGWRWELRTAYVTAR